MRNTWKKGLFLALWVVLGTALLVGCGTKPASGDQSSTAKEAAEANVKWDNDDSGYLTVNNNLQEPLILFAGTINNRHILGGVRGMENRLIDFYGQVSESNGVFLLRAIREETYRAKGSSVSSDDVISANLVSYDKNNSRMTNIDISQDLGGNAVIMLQNDSNMAMEVRINSPTGPKLTTLPPLARNQKVYLNQNPDGYIFFPIYQYYDKESMSVRSVAISDLAGGYPMNPQPEKPGMTMPVVNFNYDASKLYSPFANLVVTNGTDRGAFLLFGSTRMTSTSGMRMINPGNETFELDLQKSDHLVINSLQIDLSLGASNYLKIPGNDYLAGYNYQVQVNGQGQPLTVTQLNKSDTNNLAIQLVNEN
ncbi:MAG: hypothetical protein LBM77_12150 [Spirochaetaceae bacterium]|nr:hypothetical protein [Spirochaetaceae bacterium]